MSTLQEVRAEFARHDGLQESPPGSNFTPFNDWYFGQRVAAAWCATYLSYCFWSADMPLPFSTTKGFAWTPSGAAGFQKLDRWTHRVEVGHVVFYWWASLGRIGHVGLVDEVMSDGSFYAWEGNTDISGGRSGGRVIRQHRNIQTVNLPRGGGFGIPWYEKGATPMFDPPFDIRRVVASAKDPQSRGVWLLDESGAVFAFEGARGVRGANGTSFFAGRTAARIVTDVEGFAISPMGKILTIQATSGETYHLPA